MEIALIIVALLAAALGFWVWRLSSRAQAPPAGGEGGGQVDQAALDRLNERERELAVAKNTLAERSDQLAAAHRERDDLSVQLEGHRQSLSDAGAALAEARSERSERTEQRNTIRAERDQAQGRLEQSAEQLQTATAALAETKTELHERTEQRDTIRAERDQAREQLRQSDAQLKTAAAELAETKTELHERTEQRDTIRAERDQAQGRLEQSAEQLKTATAELAETKTELHERTEQRDTIRAERDQARERLAQSDAQLKTATAELAEAKTGLSERSELLESVTAERDQARTKLGAAAEALANTTAELAEVKADHAGRREELAKARADLDTHFKGIANEVAKSSNEEFRKQAAEQFRQQRELAEADLEKRQRAVDNLVKPVGDSLDNLQKRIREIEEKREGAYEGLHQQVDRLTSETGGLREALRSPQARGQWGEQTLQNILDLAGMREGVDYHTQVREQLEGGAIQPDVIVRLPSDKRMVIDAKTPADSYLSARESSDEAGRDALLQRHAERLLQHARELHQREYRLAEESLDFVVMFVAADAILDAALQARPAIWEETWRDYRVLLASPAVLIALLNGVAVGLQQERLYENAEEIRRAGQQLYQRLGTYAGHIRKLGSSLNSAVGHYNRSVGSLEQSVLPQARRFDQLGAVSPGSSLPDVAPLEVVARDITRTELLELGAGKLDSEST